jgi:hypothetical protein
MSDIDFDKIVEEHRNMLILSKNLSEFHINHLKNWPMLVFNDVDKCEVDWNFFDENDVLSPGYITFNFTFKQKPQVQELKKAQENLSSWCKCLFFKETEVTLLDEGKKIDE